MIKTTLYTTISFCFMLCNIQAQDVPVKTFDQVKNELLSTGGDTIKIVNFWATWCRPCLSEMPYFRDASQALVSEKIKFSYISLDFESSKEKVRATFNKYTLQGDLMILTGEPNTWIDQIDPQWQGDIPFTYMVLPGNKIITTNKTFHSTEELLSFIQNHR